MSSDGLLGVGRVGASLVRALTLSSWSSMVETPVSSAGLVGGGSVAASPVRLLNGTRAIETTAVVSIKLQPLRV